MPRSTVTMKPPGSRPGVRSFATTPTTRPKMIHPRTAIRPSCKLQCGERSKKRSGIARLSRSAGEELMGGESGARPAGRQSWRDLLFLHWPVPLDTLRPLVPRGLEIDSFAGESYVSLIPFEITESCPEGAPRAMATRFLETNVRTYVRGVDGERGVYFFSLEASSLLAVTAARLLFGLPYFHAAMRMRREGTEIEYASHRRG